MMMYITICLGVFFLAASDAALDNEIQSESASDVAKFNDNVEKSTDDTSLARIMYQNKWDGPLYYSCPYRQGLYRIKSKHSNRREDRRWKFYCRRVVYSGRPYCYTTSYINNFRDTISFRCGRNKYIAGVSSYHSNRQEDRRWRFKCCSVPSYKTKYCRTTYYVNSLDHPMNFVANYKEVITGIFSYYSRRTRDRQWKYRVCRFQKFRNRRRYFWWY